MISLAITGEQTAVHLSKDPISVVFEIFQCLGIEDLAPVLGDADQASVCCGSWRVDIMTSRLWSAMPRPFPPANGSRPPVNGSTIAPTASNLGRAVSSQGTTDVGGRHCGLERVR